MHADQAMAGEPHWVRSLPDDMRAPLVTDRVASAHNATRIRRDFAAWLAVDVAGEPAEDLVLAVYEVMANIIDHAYADHADRPGPVRLRAHRTAEHITIVISDDGHWRAPTGEPFRSRGLPLIRMLVRDVHIDTGGDGTVVHLRVELDPASPTSQ